MIDVLIDKIKEKDAPICVGLDPKLDFIPDSLKKASFDEYGLTLKGAAKAVLSFNKQIIDKISDIVPSVKIQVAMYEELGLPGMDAYIKSIEYARSSGLIVIGDIKRGDIGSTSQSYANAHLGDVKVSCAGKSAEFKAFDADFATVNPYMGSDGVVQFVDNCKKFDRGIFVLLKTSNPSSSEFQDLLTDGVPLYEKVAAKIGDWGRDLVSSNGYSEVGAVVGATYPEIGKRLRAMLPNTYFLVPGYGAQGATASELKEYFNSDGLGAIINSSRGIIAAYKNEKYADFGEKNFADAARQAAIDMTLDLRENALCR